MRNEFQNAGDATFHIVHGCAARVHVAWSRGFADDVAFPVGVAVRVWGAAVDGLGAVARCGRGSVVVGVVVAVVVGGRVTISCVLVSANAAFACWWAAGLFVRAFRGLRVLEGWGGEGGGCWFGVFGIGVAVVGFRGS